MPCYPFYQGYLLGFFGVVLVYKELEEMSSGSNTATLNNAAATTTAAPSPAPKASTEGLQLPPTSVTAPTTPPRSMPATQRSQLLRRLPFALLTIVAGATLMLLCRLSSVEWAVLGSVPTTMAATVTTSAASALELAAAHPLWLLGAALTACSWAVYERHARLTAASVEVKAAAEARLTQRDLWRAATYPKPYPNGWYKVSYSHELAPGDVKGINLCGKQLVVFRARGPEGAVGVLDAYCPHLGADLSAGGTVKGDCLECPFHRWQFATDGKVTKIPYTPKGIPARARTHAWPCIEYYGMVMVYIDQEKREPPYFPPLIPHLEEKGRMVYRGYHRAKDVRMHIQEFAENSVDFAHFDPLHGRMMVPWTTYYIPGVTVNHTADWIPGKDKEQHLATFKDTAYMVVAGRHLKSTVAYADISFVGKCSGGICEVAAMWCIDDKSVVLLHRPCWVGVLYLRCAQRWQHYHVPNPRREYLPAPPVYLGSHTWSALCLPSP